MKKSWLSLLLSAAIWGSGQFFISRQRIKGCILFGLQLLIICSELLVGYWPEYVSGQITTFNPLIHGGFFVKSLCGLLTLGEKQGRDHSTMLLSTGIVALFITLVVLAIYIYNLVDAWKSAASTSQTGYISSRQYFSLTYRRMFPYIVLAPISILFFFITVMPIIFTFLIAFTNYNRDHLPPGKLIEWVGFDNFAKLFTVPIWSQTFIGVLVWTIIWTFFVTFFSFFIGLLQAAILNFKGVKGKKFFQTVLILPWAIPQMISLLYFRNLFNGQFGPLNKFLMDIGLIQQQIPFLSDPLAARITVITVAIWLGFPMFMVMMLGVLSNIDPTLYEAASIDGANRYQTFRKITLPLILLATAPLLVMSAAGNFNGFGTIYFLTEGGPINTSYQFAGSTDILISWIYKLTLNQQMYSMASVMSILIFLVVGLVSFWNFKRTTSFREI